MIEVISVEHALNVALGTLMSSAVGHNMLASEFEKTCTDAD